MTKKSLEQKDVINLLAKLREDTPEYPAQLAKSRKESFLKQIVDIKLSGEGQNRGGGQSGSDEGKKGGRGGSGGVRGSGKSSKSPKPRGKGSSGGAGWAESRSGTGGSGARLRRGATGLGLEISLKSALAFGAVVILLTAAYLSRHQIAGVLAENNLIHVEETVAPSFASSSAEQATGTPTVRLVPVAGTPSPGSAGTGETISDSGSDSLEDNKSDIPITGDSTGSANPTPTQALSQKPGISPSQPPDNSIAGRLRFLLCVLRHGSANCK